jgi:hypothetical protein
MTVDSDRDRTGNAKYPAATLQCVVPKQSTFKCTAAYPKNRTPSNHLLTRRRSVHTNLDHAIDGYELVVFEERFFQKLCPISRGAQFDGSNID